MKYELIKELAKKLSPQEFSKFKKVMDLWDVELLKKLLNYWN